MVNGVAQRPIEGGRMAYTWGKDGAKAAPAGGKKPNILIIFGDYIAQTNVSPYSLGLMGYRTPNIDRIAREGMIFTDYYGEQSCTAGRSSFITGQGVFRTGLSKVGLPGADLGLRAEDPTIAELLKPLGYATGQFGKNHLGDKNIEVARIALAEANIRVVASDVGGTRGRKLIFHPHDGSALVKLL